MSISLLDVEARQEYGQSIPKPDECVNGLWFGYAAYAKSEKMDADLLAKAHILRGNVYVDELSWLQPDVLDSEGGEQDKDDYRSDHVVMVDYEIFGENQSAVFANMRFIRKVDDRPLPVEEEFDIAIDASLPALEMSRFMSRHVDSTVETLASIAMVSHTVGVLARERINGYAVVEVPLLRRVKGMGMAVAQLTDIKTLGSYGNTRNCAIKIDGEASLERAREISRVRVDYPYARLFEIAKYGTMQDILREAYAHVMQNKREKVVL